MTRVYHIIGTLPWEAFESKKYENIKVGDSVKFVEDSMRQTDYMVQPKVKDDPREYETDRFKIAGTIEKNKEVFAGSLAHCLKDNCILIETVSSNREDKYKLAIMKEDE